MTTAGAGNDHRLGANEAPPAIISIFLGDELNAVMESIETGKSGKRSGKAIMKIGVDTMPPLPKDTTDRNRTSPFAFTGNKFEFRTPGSSQNCAQSQMVLNTIVAESIDAISDKLEAMEGSKKLTREQFNANLHILLQRLIKKHKRVIFSGDGYSDDWTKEASVRRLPNLKDTPASLEPLKLKANRELFSRYGVLTESEMDSRYEIGLEDYNRRIRIEGAVALDIARSMISPVVADEFSRLATALGQAKKDGLKSGLKGLTALSLKLGACLDDLHNKCEKVEKSLGGDDTRAIIVAMTDLRRTVDRLEYLVDDARWPLPKYRQMLFIY
jgi:glutamine synthetase